MQKQLVHPLHPKDEAVTFHPEQPAVLLPALEKIRDDQLQLGNIVMSTILTTTTTTLMMTTMDITILGHETAIADRPAELPFRTVIILIQVEVVVE